MDLLTAVYQRLYKLYTHFMCLYDRFRASRFSLLLLYASLALSVVFVLFIAIIHNPNFEFDESNTLRIARHSYSDINYILFHEQNFSFFYYLLHFLFSIFGPSAQVAVLFCFILWLISVFLFYRLVCTYIVSSRLQVFYTLLYVFSTGITFYAFFVRMYSLVVVCLLAYFLVIVSHSLHSRTNHAKVGILAGLLLLIALLHPIALVLIPILTFITIFSWSNMPLRKVFIALAVSAFFVVVYQIVTKFDPYAVYLGRGTQFIREIRTPFFYMPGLLVFNTRTILVDVFYVFCVFFVYQFFKAQKTDFKYFFIKVFVIILGLLHVFYNTSDANSRHYIFLVVPLILSIFIGIESYKHTFLFRIFALIIFFVSFSVFFNKTIKSEIDYQLLCHHVQQITDGTIVVDWGTYNGVAYCRKQIDLPAHVLILTPEGIIDASHLSNTEMIVAQVKLGGLYWFRNAGFSGMNREMNSLRAYLQSDKNSADKIYMVTDLGVKQYLTVSELQSFSEVYSFESFQKPSIFVFRKV